MRILYIQANVTPPPANLSADRFYLLSEVLEGDILQPVWFKYPEEIERQFGPGSYPVYTVGRFRYHWFPCGQYQGAARRRAIFRFYLRKGRELLSQQRFDCIVAYSHMTTGLIGGLLKWIGRTKLVIEIATTPEYVYLTERPQPTLKERLMHYYSNVCLHVSCWMADRTHLLSPDQLDAYPLLRGGANTVFHEFVPVAAVPHKQDVPAEPRILLVGAPWYLKGADLLVEAFRELAPEFPTARLQILGHYPDSDYLFRLIDGHPRIEVLKPRLHPEVLEIISQATVVVLASRCEGMGRVLLEAMAAGVPVVGSNVGGIPFMIQDGEVGFLFPRGNSQALADRLRRILQDPALRQKLGAASYQRAHHDFNEAVYVKQFQRMVQDACSNGGLTVTANT